MRVTRNTRLVEPLLEGELGSVWIADHLGLGTRVAVKFINRQQARCRPKLVKRFQREAAIAARLQSPHVVRTFDVGVTEHGAPYMIMELLRGEPLDARLRRTGQLSYREVELLVLQTCQLLGEAHRVGIVHRDLKPANLFLVDSGYELFVKVLDFGIAKSSDGGSNGPLTRRNAVLGSPRFMSPEQFRSAGDVDQRADLWSLAVVAYQALTGAPPFPGNSLGQVVLSIMEGKRARPTELNPSLPSALDGLFDRAFADKLADRFQHAGEFAAAFSAALRRDDRQPASAASRHRSPYGRAANGAPLSFAAPASCR